MLAYSLPSSILILAAVCQGLPGKHRSIIRNLDPNVRAVSLGAKSQMQFLHQDYNSKEVRPHSGKHSAEDRETPQTGSKQLPGQVPEQKQGVSVATSADQQATTSLETTMSLLSKPAGDHREYKYAKLGNGLDVVMVQDPSTKTCAFSTAVTAGSFYDPQEHLGLAHLTEHALFLGTKAYPKETGFDEYLSSHGGSSNAYTANEATVYYASVSQPGFSEGLNRFADFFHQPLLNQSTIWAEVNAVVSEHAKNVKEPAWYTQRVMLSMANPQSPLQPFHTGDKLTLQNLGAQNLTSELISYFNENYCPPRMKLVTFCSDDFKTQLLQAEQSFGKIPRLGATGNCAEKKQDFKASNAFGKDQLQKFVLIKGTTGVASMHLLFPMENMAAWEKSHPVAFIGHMLGNQGEGGLIATLRDKLVLANTVTLSEEDTSAGTMCWMTISLTHDGAEKPNAVLDTVLTYLAHVRSQGVTDEALKGFQDSVRLSWNWPNMADAANKASDIVEGMTRLEPTELLTTDSLVEEPNVTRVTEILQKLRPQNMNVGFVTMDPKTRLEKNTKLKFKPQKLDHYGIEYSVLQLDEVFPKKRRSWKKWGAVGDSDDKAFTKSYAALAKRLCNSFDDDPDTRLYQHLQCKNGQSQTNFLIQLPKVIKDVPDKMSMDFAMAKSGTDQLSQLWGVGPTAITNTPTEQYHLRQGWKYSPQPWVEASFSLLAPKPRQSGQTASPQEYLKLQVATQVLHDAMERKLSDLHSRGTRFSVSPALDGIHIGIGAYTPLVQTDANKTITALNHALDHENPVSLNHAKLALAAFFVDTSSLPVQQAMEDVRILMNPDAFSRKELAQALESGSDITWQDVRNTLQNLRSKSFFSTGIVLGNIEQGEAKNLLSLLSGANLGNLTDGSQVEKIPPLVQPKGTVELRKLNPREGDENHVTIVNLFAGVESADIPKRVLLGIVGSVLSNVAYSELRTKKMLGYSCGGGISETSTMLRAMCYVQGTVKAPDTVEADCEDVFAVKVPQEIKNMDANTFKAHKEAYKSTLLSGPLSAPLELAHFENPILLGGCHKMRESMLAFVDTVTQDQLLTAWNEVVNPMKKSATGSMEMIPRKKLVVKYFGERKNGIPAADEATILANYKNTTLYSFAPETIARVTLERNGTHVVNEATSAVRQSLIQEGGYFPADLKCDWTAPPAPAAAQSPVVPPAAAPSVQLTPPAGSNQIMRQTEPTDEEMPSLLDVGDAKVQPSILQTMPLQPSILQTMPSHPSSFLEDFRSSVHYEEKSWLPGTLRQAVWANKKVLRSEVLPSFSF
jgi:insulysin